MTTPPTVGVFYNFTGNTSGPGKVAGNLLEGFSRLGIPWKENELGDLNGCLQGQCKDYSSLPEDTLMGPNLFVVPKDEPQTVKRYSRFVVPSQWVKDAYTQPGPNGDLMVGKKVHLWAAGIDTRVWYPEVPVAERPRESLILYVKNRPEHEYAEVANHWLNKGFSLLVLRYGSYREEDLKEVCRLARGAIFLTNTESQGIALMEVMATGTPCYIYDQPTWWEPTRGEEERCPATSAPWFSAGCGIKVQGLDHSRDEEWLGGIDTMYDPASYVHTEFSIEVTTQRYFDLLKGEVE